MSPKSCNSSQKINWES